MTTGSRGLHITQRNAHAQTAVTSFAALPGTPIAAPITWADVNDPDLTSQRWSLATVDQLLKNDPWRDGPRDGRSVDPARRRLATL